MKKRYLIYLLCTIIGVMFLVAINMINKDDTLVKIVQNNEIESQKIKNNQEIFSIEDFFSKKASFEFAELQLYPEEIHIQAKYGKPQILHSGQYYNERVYTDRNSIVSFYGVTLEQVEELIVSEHYSGISSKGIHIGSTKEQLFQSYGNPNYAMEKNNIVTYYYGDNGHYFKFILTDNIVTGMGWQSNKDMTYFNMLLDDEIIIEYDSKDKNSQM